VQKKDMTLFR